MTRARMRAATGDAGWPTRSRSRRQPPGSVQSTAERIPVAPSLRSVSVASRSCRETRATAGIAGNSRTKRATAGSPSVRQVCTESMSPSTPGQRAALEERLRRHVAALEGVRHPTAAPERHRAARDYLAAELRAMGLTVDLVPFSFRRRTYHNVVALHAGRDAGRARLLVGAHFDSTAHTPGADDNASGVAALLECARLVAA